MDSHSNIGTRATRALALAALAIPQFIAGGCAEEEVILSHPIEVRAHQQLNRLAGFVLAKSATGESPQLPRGGVSALEEWLAAVWEDNDLELEAMFLSSSVPLIHRQPSGAVRLFDPYGRPLVYQYPAKDPTYAFRLYSTGPNKVDEDGQGDDIDGSVDMDRFRAYPHSRPSH